jgi:hypothetical protein
MFRSRRPHDLAETPRPPKARLRSVSRIRCVVARSVVASLRIVFPPTTNQTKHTCFSLRVALNFAILTRQSCLFFCACDAADFFLTFFSRSLPFLLVFHTTPDNYAVKIRCSRGYVNDGVMVRAVGGEKASWPEKNRCIARGLGEAS